MTSVSDSAKRVAEHVQSNRHACYSCGDPTQGQTALCEACSSKWGGAQ